MSLVSWPIVDIIDSVDNKLFAFDILFNDILEQHAPVKSFKIRGKQNPCVTDNIRGLMKIRDKCHKEAKKTNDPLAWRTYKFFRQEVKREIRIAEGDFVAEQIQKNPNNTNNIWKTIRHCIPNKSKSQRVFSKDDNLVADEFNKFFVSAGQTTDENIKSLANTFNIETGNNDNFIPREFPETNKFSALNATDC